MLKCLLILPTGFYNFQDQLERALGEKGYQVACINDEIPGSTAIKVLSKIIEFYLHENYLNKITLQ